MLVQFIGYASRFSVDTNYIKMLYGLSGLLWVLTFVGLRTENMII
jgi:hypothetical protein